MAKADKARAARKAPKLRKVYALTSKCQNCGNPIRPGHTWKFTPEGGKVHYYCANNPETLRQRISHQAAAIAQRFHPEEWDQPVSWDYFRFKLYQQPADVIPGWSNMPPQEKRRVERQLFNDYLRAARQILNAERIENPQLTDRAYRYRANANPPDGPEICAFCGSTEQVQVGHLDGHEENTDPTNLIWNCRSCNTRLGVIFKVLGIGRLTRQYNPEARGAESYRQWALAVDSVQRRDKTTGALMGWGGKSRPMEVGAAVAMIRATPPSDRSQYAREIWRLRRHHWGQTGSYKNPAHLDLSWLQEGDTFAPDFGGQTLKARAHLYRNSDGRELLVAVDDVLAYNSEPVRLTVTSPYRQEVGIWATPIAPNRGRRGFLRDSHYSLVFRGEPGYAYGEKWVLGRVTVENPAGPTFSQAMTAARQAGARIGDTLGFEPWLAKAKLDTRSPQILDRLREEFWQGVEIGEAPKTAKESESPEQTYHGAKICKTAAGWITNIDPASVFDDLRQVKQFVDAQQKNPRRIA